MAAKTIKADSHFIERIREITPAQRRAALALTVEWYLHAKPDEAGELKRAVLRAFRRRQSQRFHGFKVIQGGRRL